MILYVTWKLSFDFRTIFWNFEFCENGEILLDKKTLNPKVEEPRKGTWDYPYLYAIRKTQASAGRVRNLSCSGIHERFSPVHNFYVLFKVDRLVRAVWGIPR